MFSQIELPPLIIECKIIFLGFKKVVKKWSCSCFIENKIMIYASPKKFFILFNLDLEYLGQLFAGSA